MAKKVALTGEPSVDTMNEQAVAPVEIHHFSPEERTAIGKEARTRCPRSSHAVWQPPPDRPDPIDLLEAQAATRIPELVPIRYGRMLASPFAFYRGAAAIMASDLATMPNTGLVVQLCGDAHLSNFGGFATAEREIILDVNDFDETLPGPWEWDVKRLAASAAIVGRESGLDAKTGQKFVLETVTEYRHAMQEFATMGNLDLWYLHLNSDALRERWGHELKPKEAKALTASIAHGHTKDNHRALEKLTRQVNGQLRIASNPPLVVPIEELLPDAEQEQVVDFLRGFIRKYRASLRGDHRHLVEDYHYVHTARKVVGVGSVGMHNWIVLLQGRDEADPLFLQVKEAQTSVLEPYLGKSIYAEHGRRVVEGQWLMQSSSDIFLGWERAEGLGGIERDFYVRQLWDWKISFDIKAMDPEEMLVYGKMCAWTLARAHARSGDPIAINAYLGKSDLTDKALVEFATIYADQNEHDYQTLAAAVKNGRIKAETGI